MPLLESQSVFSIRSLRSAALRPQPSACFSSSLAPGPEERSARVRAMVSRSFSVRYSQAFRSTAFQAPGSPSKRAVFFSPPDSMRVASWE